MIHVDLFWIWSQAIQLCLVRNVPILEQGYQYYHLICCRFESFRSITDDFRGLTLDLFLKLGDWEPVLENDDFPVLNVWKKTRTLKTWRWFEQFHAFLDCLGLTYLNFPKFSVSHAMSGRWRPQVPTCATIVAAATLCACRRASELPSFAISSGAGFLQIENRWFNF